jgi:hypothetical protein
MNMKSMHRILVVGAALAASWACALPPGSNTPTPDSFRSILAPDDSAVSELEMTPTATAEPSALPCNPGSGIVAVIVDPELFTDIRTGLDQFVSDLCIEGYSVVVESSPFASATDLRAYLATLHEESGFLLQGSILIGDIPRAYQWVSLEFSRPDMPPLEEEVISFQFYADLDGVFARSPGYSSPGGYAESFDIHEGDVAWEQWVGVLPLYRGDYASSVLALNFYFEKNHAYRAGEYELGNAFMQITEHFTAYTITERDQILEDMRSGTYSWTPLSLEPDSRFYFNSPQTNQYAHDGYEDLSLGLASLVTAGAHGYWGAHGEIDIAWAESHPIRTVFFWSDGCSVGNLDHPENFLSSVLYSSLSTVLVAKGTTNNSGGMGTNSDGYVGHNIATALDAGSSFGDAVLGHVNVPLIHPWSDSREFHFATPIFLGDPTLTLSP